MRSLFLQKRASLTKKIIYMHKSDSQRLNVKTNSAPIEHIMSTCQVVLGPKKISNYSLSLKMFTSKGWQYNINRSMNEYLYAECTSFHLEWSAVHRWHALPLILLYIFFYTVKMQTWTPSSATEHCQEQMFNSKLR